MTDEHVMEALGKTRIVVRDGKVIEVGEPLINFCPLAVRFEEPVKTFSKEEIKRNIEFRIKKFGMLTKNRIVVSDEEFVPFGASELISFGLKKHMIGGAVIAADCAGTVVTKNPSLVQGLGGRLSGLVKTSPIPEVIKKIEQEEGIVLDKETARIDQPAGVELAYKLGMSNVAVTVVSAKDAEAVRSKYEDSWIFAVHLTGISKEETKRLLETCDMITACASKWVREIAGKKALLQAGATIPMFTITQKAKNLVLERLKNLNRQVFVKLEKLPFTSETSPSPLV
ncbi:MAG: methanogenesis marker 8 protein [Candidatus Bathyarchaeota archaeon]